MEKAERKETALEAARRNFNRWNESLQTRNPEEVASLYRDDCVFLPTFPEKGKEVVGKDGVANYFHHFLQKFPFGVIVKEEVRDLGDSSIFHAGRYNFEVGPEDSRSVAEAKFTFVWKKEGDEWKILLHDSAPLNK